MESKRLTRTMILDAWRKYVPEAVRMDMTSEEMHGSFTTFAGAFKEGWKAATKPAGKKGKKSTQTRRFQ